MHEVMVLSKGAKLICLDKKEELACRRIDAFDRKGRTL